MDIGVSKEDGSHAEEYYRNIYDMEFNPVSIKETREHYDYSKIRKPDNFDFMIECARKLSKPFPHCRIDLYNINGTVIFGEITFFMVEAVMIFNRKRLQLRWGIGLY